MQGSKQVGGRFRVEKVITQHCGNLVEKIGDYWIVSCCAVLDQPAEQEFRFGLVDFTVGG